MGILFVDFAKADDAADRSLLLQKQYISPITRFVTFKLPFYRHKFCPQS